MTTPVEPVEFRTGQRAKSSNAARPWKTWSRSIDEGVVSVRLVEPAGSRPGHRVLRRGRAAMSDMAQERAAGDRPFTISNPARLAVGEA
jgi:hypothetical protein